MSKVCYIGFSATPMANIYIEYEENKNSINQDLFPKDFIFYLDPPKTYVGARAFFGQRKERYPYIRIIKERKNDGYIGEKSLHESIQRFLLIGAIRELRGFGNSHNSMLINNDRIKKTHKDVEESVNKYIQLLKDKIKTDGTIKEEYRIIWEDIKIRSYKIHKKDLEIGLKNKEYDLNFDFDKEVYEEVIKYLREKVEVRVINSDNQKNRLNYEEKEDEGLHVIAIGSDAFSRGFTLEGLTVTYMLRNSPQLDNLLQSCRFFSHYRPDYRDLVSVYISKELAISFQLVNKMNNKLIDQIKEMDCKNKTPLDFGLYMEEVRNRLTNIKIIATNKNKMQDSMSFYKEMVGKYLGVSRCTFDANKNKENIDNFRSMILDINQNITPEEFIDENKNLKAILFECKSEEKKFIIKFLESMNVCNEHSKLRIDFAIQEFKSCKSIDVVIRSNQGKDASRTEEIELINQSGISKKLIYMSDRSPTKIDYEEGTFDVSSDRKTILDDDKVYGILEKEKGKYLLNGVEYNIGNKIIKKDKDYIKKIRNRESRGAIYIYIINGSYMKKKYNSGCSGSKLYDNEENLIVLGLYCPKNNSYPVISRIVNRVYEKQIY